MWSPVTMLPTTMLKNTALCLTYSVSTIISMSYSEMEVSTTRGQEGYRVLR